MSIKNLVPRFGRKSLPVRQADADPFRDFQRQMNRLFDDFFGDFPLAERDEGSAWVPGAFVPRVDISETDDQVKVSAELPGMDDKDITVELQDDVLTIRGEKKSEHDDKGHNWFHREQSWGAFQRSIALPAGVEADQAKAQFKKGVLTFSAPKRAEERPQRHAVTIQAE